MPLHNDLPPLMSLRAFEAVARHLSFGKAAQELSLTQSAVSHQVHKLEESLGLRLFDRLTRAIELTPAGEHYYRHIRRALEIIACGTRDVRSLAGRSRTLRIGLLASFATQWLAPRLALFAAENPHIDIELVPSVALANVAAHEVDLSIRYGRGDWPNVSKHFLMHERLSPVCSPALKAALPQAPARLDQVTHIPLLVAQATTQFEWIAWCRRFNVSLERFQMVQLHDYNIVIEMATEGQGIAMGRHQMIGKRLREGVLVELLDNSDIIDDIGYWLLTPPNDCSESCRRFVDWIQNEANK
ncbi:LysR family transcriptional regulator [Affinibrenneria salicis]|uniref:LysR family transcriptional regulator n=1 Tax=Affinibrenneria salicis TaxID=2590031 RepID=A0A5J5G4D3_9GAMM|nr:LysR substrate-binding domain-containing protein [Affinibrenneria salicis]KAA9001723.1 LysR family transcriptional regulator [Affinibrenneria salicis]